MSAHHGMNQLKGIHEFCSLAHREQRRARFGRMFPDLPPLYIDPTDLAYIGGLEGPMVGSTPAQRTLSVPVGHIFFGQFIDHDITLDITSSLAAVADPGETINVRTPTLDLDCVYGLGPEASNYLYHQNSSREEGDQFREAKLLTGEDTLRQMRGNREDSSEEGSPSLAEHDLSRTPHGTAIIGDFRNDENRVISQLQLAMIRFHNKVCDKLYAESKQYDGDGKLINELKHKDLYAAARQLVTWHYQWVVLTDFLVKLCGRPVVADILGKGRRFFCIDEDDEPFIPVEFSVAAYRFGHSMIPQQVQVKPCRPTFDLFGEELGSGFKPLDNLDAVVDWSILVDTGSGATVQMAETLDATLAPILINLPFIREGEKSLATRNLLRGQSFLLPSGENVAHAMGRSPSEIKKVRDAALQAVGGKADLSAGTPLWYYILTEAEVIGRETEPEEFQPCEGLGPIGARIVAETIVGLLELDERSFLGTNRNWRPEIDGLNIKTLGELLAYASAPQPAPEKEPAAERMNGAG